MRIIPVLDLMDGLVVRARFGDRASYRPIETPLSPDAQPLHVAAGLMGLFPFDALYVADLDGITGRGRNDAAVLALRAAHPDVEIWVDNGIAAAEPGRDWLRWTGARLVLGTESLASPAPLADLRDRAVLSLDFRGGDYLGPPEILADAFSWPRDVIAMTLAQVGSGAGPDRTRLAEVTGRAGRERRVFAAGGVRDLDDLRRLAESGIAGALVATALHDGRLDRPALEQAAALQKKHQ